MLNMNTVYNIDCIEGLASIKNTFDAVVTSPPYFCVPCSGQAGLGNTPEEYIGNLSIRLNATMQALKKDGVLFLNIGDPLRNMIPWKIINNLVNYGYKYYGELIWVQSEKEHESIYVLSAGTQLKRSPVSGVIVNDKINGIKFPEALVENCLNLVTIPTGKVLDPFMGLGTTAIVAKKMGWQFMGFEKDRNNWEKANKII